MKRLIAISLLIFLGLQASGQRLIPFLPEPEKSNGIAVIVCPGGSYYWLSRTKESVDVAERLRQEGFAAFVLYYRHAGTRYFLFRGLAFPQNHYPDALEDIAAAVREIRSRATENSVDPSKVGVVGFSAGGHLALDAGKELSGDSRPSFIAAVYPVVTMSDEEIVHDRSRRALLGKHYADADLRRRLSMELDVPCDMPPVFIAACKDDPTVDYRNSVVMDEALSKAGVLHGFELFETGGHGFGLSSPTADWLPFFLDFIGNCVY